jgi:hypothetical protein
MDRRSLLQLSLASIAARAATGAAAAAETAMDINLEEATINWGPRCAQRFERAGAGARLLRIMPRSVAGRPDSVIETPDAGRRSSLDDGPARALARPVARRRSW